MTPPIYRNMGRAFVEGLLEITGNVEAAVDTLMHVLHKQPRPDARTLLNVLLLPRTPLLPRSPGEMIRGRKHSQARDAAAIAAHYDQPAAFFKTFLDPELVYSCAYFDEGAQTLASAQFAKIDLVLAKLRLAPGERLLDIGCGWGALSFRAAERYGARAHALTLSRGQYEEASRRVAERKLEDRVTVELRDYRTVPAESYDKIAAIGITEHIGREQLAEYFEIMHRALRPGGLFLNHCITDQESERHGMRRNGSSVHTEYAMRKKNGFINRYIFPDAELLRISKILLTAEGAGFEVRDVENIREHYARTCREWVANLEANAEAAVAATDERIVRMWRLYMAGSAQGFASGRLGLCQALLERPRPDGKSDLPPTRRDLYTSA